MDILIRKGSSQDLPAAHALICELAAFEKAPQEVINTPELMDTQWKEGAFEFFVAEHSTGVVGLALYFYSYSTWKGRSLYLDDLYVKPEFRNSKTGKKLLDAIVKTGLEKGVSKIHWQVLDWNTDAIRFYEKYGVAMETEWINCKLEEDYLLHYPFE